MIGEFIARWEEAADGVTMDADTAQVLAREFARMRSLIYCPGQLRCEKCDFRLTKIVLTPAGAFANEEPDRCPNCDVPMLRVTWKDEADQAYKVAESQMERALAAERRGTQTDFNGLPNEAVMERAEKWLRECSTWILTHDLDMCPDFPMGEDPLDIADDLAAYLADTLAECLRMAIEGDRS